LYRVEKSLYYRVESDFRLQTLLVVIFRPHEIHRVDQSVCSARLGFVGSEAGQGVEAIFSDVLQKGKMGQVKTFHFVFDIWLQHREHGSGVCTLDVATDHYPIGFLAGMDKR